MKTNTLMPVIKAILNDEEFLCGGIFTKEKQYAKKYDLTMEEIGMQILLERYAYSEIVGTFILI